MDETKNKKSTDAFVNFGGLKIRPVEEPKTSQGDETKNTLPPLNAKKVSDISFDIGEILEKEDARTKKLSEKTGNIFVDFGHKINQWVIGLTPIKLNEKVAYFQLLSVMIDAGIPLVKSVAILSDQMENLRFKSILIHMTKLLDKGMSLSEAMTEHYHIFTESQIGMVAAAEASGQLDEVLHQLAKEMEKKERITARVKGAMRYPAVIFALLVIVAVLMLIFVVPKIVTLFTESKVDLPWPTKMLIFISGALSKWWFLTLGVLLAVFVAVWLWKKTETGKYYLDFIILYLPILGKLNRKISLSRFSRSLSNLIRSGIPIVKALYIDANAIGNEVYRRRVELAAEDVKRGIPLGENLSGNKFLFPTMITHMIYVGEQTAQLDVICEKIADFYDEEIDVAVSSLARIMEPLIIVLVGVGVGFMVAAVMMPMLQLIDITAVL